MPGRGLLRTVRAALAPHSPPPGDLGPMSDQPADRYASPQHAFLHEGVLVMTQTAFAQRRGVRASYVRNLVGKRRIPRQLVVTIGGRRMLKVEALEQWLDTQGLAMNGRPPVKLEPAALAAPREPSPFFARMARIEGRQGELIGLLTALHRRLDEWVGLGVGPRLVERLALVECKIEGVAALAKDRLDRPETVAAPTATALAPPPFAPELDVEHIAHLDRQADERVARETEQAAIEASLARRHACKASPALDVWALEQILFNKPSGRFWTGHDGLERRWSEDPAGARTFRTEALAEDARRFHKLTSWRAVELIPETRHG